MSQEIIFVSGQSKVIVTIPILDDAIADESDKSFFVNIMFNRGTIARCVVTIVDNDHGKLVIM